MPLHMLPRTQIQTRVNTQTRAQTYGGENYSMLSHGASAARKIHSCWYEIDLHVLILLSPADYSIVTLAVERHDFH